MREWHSGMAPYTDDWKVHSCNPSDALSQALSCPTSRPSLMNIS